jgi:mono/diheme cytochrome c family protein
MRTNFAGFFLAAGMGLIVLLLGLGALSMAGLVGFSANDAQEKLDRELKEEAEELGRHDIFSSTTYPSAPATPTGKEGAAIVAGDALFKANCAQCHAVNEKVVGPALAGITKRRSISWLVPWVQNSAKVIASGDEYGVKLYNENGKQQMPSFGLSKKEIEDIMAWVNANEGAVASAPGMAAL